MPLSVHPTLSAPHSASFATPLPAVARWPPRVVLSSLPPSAVSDSRLARSRDRRTFPRLERSHTKGRSGWVDIFPRWRIQLTLLSLCPHAAALHPAIAAPRDKCCR